MQKKDGGNWTDEQYRNAVAGLTAPLIVIEILFLVVAVLLFATQKERWDWARCSPRSISSSAPC